MFKLTYNTFFAVGALCLFAIGASAQQKASLKAVNGSQYTPFALSKGIAAKDYRTGTLVVKIKPEYAAVCDPNNISDKTFQNALIAIGANDIKKAFANTAAPVEKTNKNGQKFADLSTIYRLQYSTSRMTIETAINTLLRTGMVTYAEPDYIYPVDAFTPNDPQFASQTFLTRIKATNAWDLALGGSQGDASTIVAIVDSGMDLDHPDLASQYYVNTAETIDGIDNDNDGYIDNRFGWDLGGADYNTVVADNDPNAMGANNSHGVHVSGCAGAATNNGIGVSGIGFNCKLLAVKCSADNDTRGSGGVGYIIAGYDGIKYAADHGAQIINCSWGGTGGGQFGQDIIDYATINKNALVIAAAGNDNADIAHFPSSYNYVLSVCATNSNNDTRASFSNYGFSVDIAAPGNGILATDYDNTYSSQSGTSMASPITAGAAGLVRSKFPNLNALQIGERLRATSDNHYTGTNAGPLYKNKLGKGRLNVFNALTVNTPSLRVTPLTITDNNDEAWVAGETLQLRATFTNFLDPATNMVCTLAPVAATTAITIVNGTYTIPALGTLANITNAAAPYSLTINASAAANLKIPMKITMTNVASGGTYTDTHFFDMIVNVDYINVHVNQVGTTITSKGRTGYNGTGQLEGLGFVYRDSSILYEMGFLAGTSPTRVSDNIRGASATYNDHWRSENRILVKQNNLCSEKDLFGRFNDSGNTTTPLGAKVDHKFYAWSNPGDDKYVIVRYVFHNTSAAAWDNFYVGMFADWDITSKTYARNKVGEDAGTKMGYAYCSDANGIYGGIKVLSSTPFKHYGLDNLVPPAGVIDITDTDGYSTADKYNTMAGSNPTAGTQSAAGNDVLDIVSTGPFNVAAGDSITIAYALIGGDNLADLIASANAAQLKYDNVIIPCEATVVATDNTDALIATMTAQPNPSTDFTQIKVNMVEAANTTLNLSDLTGKTIRNIYTGAAQQGNNAFDLNTADLANGTYIYTLQTGAKTVSQRIVVLK
jgi:serine protease